MSFDNLIGANVSKEIQDDIEMIQKFTLFLNEIDVANLSATVSKLPDDEYFHEASEIWAYYKQFGVKNIEGVITEVFYEAFYPLEVQVPIEEIINYLMTLKTL